MFVVRRGRPRGPEVVPSGMTAVFHPLLPTATSELTGGRTEAARWRPALEVYETDDALVVQMEIAGIAEERLEVTVDIDRLAIRGERPAVCPDERRSYHEARIPYGGFGADVYIPFPVDADATEAEYQQGFLRIVLPRSAARTITARHQSGEAEGREGAR